MNRAQAGALVGAIGALRPIRGRSALVIAMCTVAFTTITSYAERRAGLGDAASRALQGPTFGLAIPIATLVLVSAGLMRKRLDDAMTPAALLGADRRAAVMGAAIALALAAALLGLLAACSSALAAHGPPTLSSVQDALTSGWIGALTAITYTFVFLAASSFGSSGGFRLAVLAADLMLGPMSGPAAVWSPRAHALNLLGAPEVAAGLSQAASSGAMLVIIGLCCGVMLWRVRS